MKNQRQTKNVDANSNISEKKNSIARIIKHMNSLFSLQSFNQSETRKYKNICLMKKKKKNI